MSDSISTSGDGSGGGGGDYRLREKEKLVSIQIQKSIFTVLYHSGQSAVLIFRLHSLRDRPATNKCTWTLLLITINILKLQLKLFYQSQLMKMFD